MLVEIDHKHLVVRVTGAGERQCSRDNFSPLLAHASTVVDDQADGDRDIVVAEVLDLLKCSVFVDLKAVFIESRNKDAFVVLRRGVQDHKVGTYLDAVSLTGAVL